MVTDSTGDKKPKLVHMGRGLAILLILVAVVVGVPFLGNPYYAIAEVATYALFVAVVAVRLRSCLRLAKDSEYSAKLKAVAFWLFLAVFTVFARLGSIIGNESRDYVRLATSGVAYLALYCSLEVVEDLLKKAAAKSQPGLAPESAGGSAPNPTLQRTGPG
jgi:hypothetical protein